METAILILQIIFFTLAGFAIIYLLCLSLFSLKAKLTERFDTSGFRKFAVVIPAHNEEVMITQTLYSMFGLVYPRNYYDVIVVADNCTDKTAQIAAGMGAIVWERRDEVNRGKGYALRWAMSRICRMPEYEAVVVFDADSLVSGNYLTVMNYYLEHGSKVIQGSDRVQSQPDVWSSEITRIGFTLYNYVRPMGRKALGLSMGLRGNGMCFTTDVLRRIPWQAYSLAEDIEYGIILMLNDINIDFAPEAEVVAKMPEQTSHAESQRQRWEIGRYPVIKRYSGKLLSAGIKRRSPAYLDTLIDLVMPPLVNIYLIILLMLLLSTLLWSFGIAFSGLFTLLWFLLASAGIIAVFIGFRSASADNDLYRALLYVPKYALWKIKIYFKALGNNRKGEWVRTTRSNE